MILQRMPRLDITCDALEWSFCARARVDAREAAEKERVENDVPFLAGRGVTRLTRFRAVTTRFRRQVESFRSLDWRSIDAFFLLLLPPLPPLISPQPGPHGLPRLRSAVPIAETPAHGHRGHKPGRRARRRW